MITKLEELTIGQFIDLICGDTSVLVPSGEKVSEKELADALYRIASEYRTIADPAGAKLHLSQIEDLHKAKMTYSIYSICRNLLDMEKKEEVLDILDSLEVNAGSWSDQRLDAEVTSRLERAKRELKDLQDEEEVPTTEQIRRQFDEQTAALMAHFKFQIEVSTMKATLYAHLLARHNREIKAQLAALKK